MQSQVVWLLFLLYFCSVFRDEIHVNNIINTRKVWRAWVPTNAFTIRLQHKIFATMKKQMYLCVDLQTQMKRSDLKVMDSRKGTLHRTDEDKFTFIEKGVRTYATRPELHWRLLDRTKHGKIKYNAQHVMVQLYIQHDDYKNGHELADILASEIETMGETLCQIDIKSEVEACY